ncbi:capsule biosynthesis protein CapA [Ruminiclostridium hungatei]|uniref:Capsule biosynthesis protein CapA n=1 Tax=Ruminiclostridium hungatei TaxID=48256 RepID=A0A1V4SIP2_RUMHU|nr:CapA family protein [Ruminiclostridium hungatei]OPX43762.1 capsule biosynthesis protein CapA [Ruminiclostridium hungatei]
MKTKFRLFKHTFIVLSIMCCFLLGSTSIIYALSDFSVFAAASNPPVSSQSPSAGNTPAAAGTASPSASETSETTEGTAPSTGGTDNPAAQTSSQPSNPQPGNTPGEPSGNTGSENQPGNDKPVPAHTTKTAAIAVVGDIMAHQGNLNNAYSPKTGTYDFTGFLEYVRPYLSKADLTIGNFETVTAGPKTGYTSYPSFNTPDAILTALSGAGFDILSTANNHCLDRGITGLTRTIQMINKNKMINVGSSTNGKDKYVFKEVNGIKLGILAYSGIYNGLDKKLSASQKSTYLSPINEQQMQKDIKAVKAAGSDAVIVIVHWGTEYQRTPDASQTSLSKKLLNWGADIILGSHPHVIQKSEIVKVNGKDKFIIYSMGNFISGYRRVDKAARPNKIYTEDGIIVNLLLEKDSKNNTVLKTVDYVPTWVDKYYANNRPVFKIIPIPDSNNISGKYVTSYNKPFIQQSYKNTMGIMAKMK